MDKILVSAYACSPYEGSEPGMGWNFLNILTDQYEVDLITETKWKRDLERYFSEHGACPNLRIHYVTRKRYDGLRRLWPPSYYYFYRQWQKNVFKLAIELSRNNDYLFVHQLNMAGYREPGYLWRLSEDFVWGPVGGIDNAIVHMLNKSNMIGRLYFSVRNGYNNIQRVMNKRVRKIADKRNKLVLAATEDNKRLLNEVWGIQSHIVSEVGLYEFDFNIAKHARLDRDPLRIVWSGAHINRKNLPLLLDSLEGLDFPFVLTILGSGPRNKFWKRYSERRNLDHGEIVWKSQVKRSDAIKIMSEQHVFCISSIYDLTSTVLLEALSIGLPVAAPNAFGFKDVINSDVGVLLSAESREDYIKDLRLFLSSIYLDEDKRVQLASNAVTRAQDFAWNLKALRLKEIFVNIKSL